jgi:nucleotide-binding universal stress UspA family protein
MMRTILVPLDGSALAEHVLPYAQALAALLEARLHLLRVIPDSALEHGDTFGYDLAAIYGVAEAITARQEHERRMRELLRERAESYLARQAAALAHQGFDVGTEVRFGPPAEMIVETAEGEHVALIAVATHGYSGLKRWALGSTADKVVHATCTPVLLVRGEAAEAPQLRRVLLPLDGSPLAQQALPLAAELAARARGELVLLRAIVPTVEIIAGLAPATRMPVQYEDLTEPMREFAQQELEDLAAQLRAEVPRVIPLAPVGSAAELIVDEAVLHHADLIVMATHGYGGLRRWALGSTADKVLHATTTPLILVRAKP